MNSGRLDFIARAHISQITSISPGPFGKEVALSTAIAKVELQAIEEAKKHGAEGVLFDGSPSISWIGGANPTDCSCTMAVELYHIAPLTNT